MTASPPVVGTDTYISVEDATALAADRLHAGEWRAAVEAHTDTATVPAICRQALTTATAILDGLGWSGVPSDPSQALAWPRRGARDGQGAPLPANAVPEALSVACAELAFHLLANEPHAPRSTPLQMVMVGQSMETYFPTVADDLPPRVRRRIAPYLIVRSKHSSEMMF